MDNYLDNLLRIQYGGSFIEVSLIEKLSDGLCPDLDLTFRALSIRMEQRLPVFFT